MILQGYDLRRLLATLVVLSILPFAMIGDLVAARAILRWGNLARYKWHIAAAFTAVAYSSFWSLSWKLRPSWAVSACDACVRAQLLNGTARTYDEIANSGCLHACRVMADVHIVIESGGFFNASLAMLELLVAAIKIISIWCIAVLNVVSGVPACVWLGLLVLLVLS